MKGVVRLLWGAQALKSSSDEYSRILDLAGCYAIFKPEAGFTVKKQVHICACASIYFPSCTESLALSHGECWRCMVKLVRLDAGYGWVQGESRADLHTLPGATRSSNIRYHTCLCSILSLLLMVPIAEVLCILKQHSQRTDIVFYGLIHLEPYVPLQVHLWASGGKECCGNGDEKRGGGTGRSIRGNVFPFVGCEGHISQPSRPSKAAIGVSV